MKPPSFAIGLVIIAQSAMAQQDVVATLDRCDYATAQATRAARYHSGEVTAPGWSVW